MVTTTHLKPDEQFVGRIDTPYAVQLLRRGNGLDHASMRAKQLNGLLLLMTGDGYETFQQLNDNYKESMLWLAQQFAAELEDMLDLVAKDAKGGAQ